MGSQSQRGRSLEEGMEETLTVHRLRVPPHVRTGLASTNLNQISNH
jgi:hypothetical protein